MKFKSACEILGLVIMGVGMGSIVIPRPWGWAFYAYGIFLHYGHDINRLLDAKKEGYRE